VGSRHFQWSDKSGLLSALHERLKIPTPNTLLLAAMEPRRSIFTLLFSIWALLIVVGGASAQTPLAAPFTSDIPTVVPSTSSFSASEALNRCTFLT